MLPLIIESRLIGDYTLPYVIANIDGNHKGQVSVAIELIHAAANSGANAVALQRAHNKTSHVPYFYDMPHEHGKTYGEYREALELPLEDYATLFNYARQSGIDLLVTAFDEPSLDDLARFGVSAIKIASADISHGPLLKRAREYNRPLILSTGGATLDDLVYIGRLLRTTPHALLQSTMADQPMWSELNLRVITTYRRLFPDVVIGYEDYKIGTAMSLAAYVLGARIIEKPFTLKRYMDSRSVEPHELEDLVQDLKHAHLALGDGLKRRYDSEREQLRETGKMIVAARNLECGVILTDTDLEFRCPADGLPPYEVNRMIGLTVTNPIAQYEPVRFEDLQE